jgi:hypothetical protein
MISRVDVYEDISRLESMDGLSVGAVSTLG